MKYVRTSLLSFLFGAFALFAVQSFGQDVYEPDDSYTDGTAVTWGTTQDHSINPSGDEDWFVINVISGRTYRIETSEAGTPEVGQDADTLIYLYDDSLKLIDFDDDDDDSIDSNVVWPFSLLEFTAQETRVLYVRVKCLLTTSVGDYAITFQDMALASGPETYGQSTASGPAIAFDERGWPIEVYTDLDTNGVEQVYVRRWLDNVGDSTTIGQWISLSGEWYGLDGSVAKMQVSQAGASASFPAVAVDGSKVYITWMNKDTIDEAGKIYMAYWDGAQFEELGDSMTGYGLSPTNQNFGDKQSSFPFVGVAWDDQPIVGYQQAFIDPAGDSIVYNQSIVALKYDGTNSWRGLDGTARGAVPGGSLAFYPDMDMDDNGYPLIAWGEPAASSMLCYRWNGTAWAQVGTSFGTSPFSEKPSVVAGPGGSVYASWLQYYVGPTSYLLSNDVVQVYAAQLSGGSWVALGDSMTPPGISKAGAGGTETPNYADIALNTNGNPMVTWQSGAGATNGVSSNGVLFAQWDGSAWVGIDGSDTLPGISSPGGTFNAPNMDADKFGRPGIVVFNENSNGVRLLTYKIGGIEPPVFQGLREVESTTNGYVVLKWAHATSPDPLATYTSVTYHIYRSDLNNYSFAGNPDLEAIDVFDSSMLRFTTNIATSVTAPQFVLYPPELNKIYGFGVRAEVGGLVEANTAIRYGAATNENVIPPLPISDTDGDGIDDALDPNPNNPDENNNGIPDGDEVQLGWDPATTGELVDILIHETFPGPGLPGTWDLQGAVNLWHWTLADPSPPGTNPVPMHAHSTNGSMRMAKNDPPNDPSTTYDMGSQFVRCSLITEPFDPGFRGVSSLVVSWNEFYDTESQWDICNVAVRHDDGGLGDGQWKIVRTGVSGNSGDWIHREIDITDWYNENGQPDNVRVRFEFLTLNNINNAFGGWYVDDVKIYGTPVISGNVRDLNGDYVVGANIYAIGLGNVTNTVNGQLIVKPGKIFAQTTTDSLGNYTIRNIPQGQYYVKADAPGFKAEFWNGQLYGAYVFGNVGNEGVHDIRQATPLTGTTNANFAATCNFELNPGEGRTFLGVYSSPTGSAFTPLIDQFVKNAMIWDGNTTVGGTNLMVFRTDRPDTVVFPDYETNPVIPNELGDLAFGEHTIYMHEGSTSVPLIKPVLREGEATRVYVSTNNPTGGLLHVLCDRSGDAIFVNGRNTGLTAPATVTGLAAGWHEVVLQPGGLPGGVLPVEMLVSTGGTSFVNFESKDVWDEGLTGGAIIRTVDVFGNALTGATVYLNGMPLNPNLIEGTNTVTPLTLKNLRPNRTLNSRLNQHRVVVHKDGYRWSAQHKLLVDVGVTNTYKITLISADEDYDRVRDVVEISSYTNIFNSSTSDDADGDGLTNLFESDQFNLNGIVMNLNNPDTDGDGMSDFDEVNYDGNPDWIAISTLASNVSVKGSTVYAYFRGSYLDGQSAFNLTPGPMSIEGDEFFATNVTMTLDSTGVPVYRIQVATVGLPRSVVSENHLIGAVIYADTMPDVQDTDGDLMWDGFEYIYMLAGVSNLSPINAGAADEDPDNDGLTNYEEFLGSDRLANTNDWTNPGNPDTDGDGMPDGWEYKYGLDPNNPNDANSDMDSDGLTNLQEFQYGTDPTSADTDNDGLLDGAEVFVYGTDPTNFDSDGDGVWDGDEVYVFGTDPLNWDTDGDGMPDGFEVLELFPGPDGRRAHRPQHRRLDPLNPLDADIDSDGDGLTNLQEYLVRDGLYGNPPAGTLWDYSTDPFNPDSDGDGMPDGWEVMHGLHPQDPVPNAESSNGLLVRNEELWIFGDLDGDGLDNINEYTVRFLNDPDADPYAIEGSCDPRNWDTDGDGLADGEEVKTYRTNPLKQDTDGDGLIDGTDPNGLIRGEVSSLTNAVDAMNAQLAGMSYDRALNDLWAVQSVPGDFTLWQQLQEDKDPEPLNVWGANAQGVIVIDVTNTYRAPAFNQGFWSNAVTYYTGNYFVEDAFNPAVPPDAASPGSLQYWFELGAADVYQISVETDGSFGSADYDFWLKIDGDAYIPTYSTDASGWNFDLVVNGSGLPVNEIIFGGQHSLTIHPGASFYDVRQIRIFPANMSTNIAYSPAQPHSPVVGLRSDRPPRRWGCVGSAHAYNVRDTAAGDYVGRTVSGLGAGGQLLLSANQLYVAGGRNGSVRYDDFWRLSDMTAWSSEYFEDDYAGRSELVMAPYTFTSSFGAPSGRGQISRPRPGQATEYEFYTTAQNAQQLWGENGVNNLALSYYLTGWDQQKITTYPNSQRFAFYPNSSFASATWGVHDATEKWTYLPPADLVANKHHGADFAGATYTWRNSQHYTVVKTNDAVEQAQDWIGWEHPTAGGGVTNIYVSGIQIENVLNTRSCYANSLLMFSTLNFATVLSSSTQTGPIPIRVYGELAYLNRPTVQNQRPHATWSGDEDYTVVSPADRFGFTDGAYEATNNSFYLKSASYVDFTVPLVAGAPGSETPANISIDVTDIIDEMFSMTQNVAGNQSFWEYGNDFGFVISINTNAVGAAPLGTNRLVISEPNLSITVQEPGWAAGSWLDTVNVDHLAQMPTPVPVPYQRKSSATAVSSAGSAVIFGGVDGNRVLDDTWIADPQALSWTQVRPTQRPPARWGHSMVPGSAGVILFGGFDKNNEPLNDLWVFDGAEWYEITHFANPESGILIPDKIKPRPRGGAFFGLKGGEPCLFGGTDGKSYFNDTWIIKNIGGVPSSEAAPWRWMMTEPNGQRYENTQYEPGPPPKAFGATMWQGGSMFIFGGRTGLLPTSKDTDGDWVEDKVEIDLGGPAAGRDPRANAMITSSAILNTNGTETLPYSFKHVGGVIYDPYSTLPYQFRTLIADFESLSHPHELGGGPEWQHTYGAFAPFEGKRTPPPTVVDFIEQTGYDAIDVGFTNLWWHPVAYTNGAWELGAPDTDTGIGPAYAYSGRWCFGTDMDSGYPNNSTFELYSPLYSLTMPSANSTDPSNPNDFYLVYREWLELKQDSSDTVKIEAIKPTTAADIATRTSPGVMPVEVLPPRNYSYNTTGEWRQVIVPLSTLFNEPKVFLRFTLNAGDSGTGGGGAGWYIDDVAILQAAELSGTYGTAGAALHLVGTNGVTSDAFMSTITDASGNFGFSGLIPAGDYQIVGGTSGTSGHIAGNASWNISVSAFTDNTIVLGISVNSPAKIIWNSVAGATYEVQYCTPATLAHPDPWVPLATVVATGDVSTYIDLGSDLPGESSRFYRVVVTEM